MDSKFTETLKGKKNKIPPMWLMRQAGRYLPEYNEVRKKAGTFLDLCYNPELAAEVTMQPIKRFDFDAAIIFSDILVIPHAMGMHLEYIEGTGPVLGEYRQEKIITGNVAAKLKPVFEAIKLVRKRLDRNKALIGFAGAPWTVATYIVEGGSSKDFHQVKKMVYSENKEFKRLIDMLIEETAEYLCLQIEAGADAIQIFDSWAGALAADEFEKWSIEPNKKIISKVRDRHPGIPIIGFPKGCGVGYEKFIHETGVDGVSIDSSVPLEWAAEKLQKHVCMQGNLDPELLSSDATKIPSEVKRIIDTLAAGPFIFNLGHGILPSTPIENVELLVRAVRGE